MKILTIPQAAYLAGLIDGEGSVECQKQIQKNGKTPRYVIRVSFTMATKEPLHTIAQWLECKVKVYPAADSRRSPRHRLHIPKNKTVSLLHQCLPYLIEKPQQARLLLKIESLRAALSPSRIHTGTAKLQPMPSEWERQAEPLYRKLRSLKSNKRPGRPGWPKH